MRWQQLQANSALPYLAPLICCLLTCQKFLPVRLPTLDPLPAMAMHPFMTAAVVLMRPARSTALACCQSSTVLHADQAMGPTAWLHTLVGCHRCSWCLCSSGWKVSLVRSCVMLCKQPDAAELPYLLHVCRAAVCDMLPGAM